MNHNIKILSPIEVSQKYLLSDSLRGKIGKDFNIFKLEELLLDIRFPHAPFKNTAHGFIVLLEGEIKMSLNQEEFLFLSGSVVLTPAGQMNNFVEIHPVSKGFIGTFSDNFLFQKFEQSIISILEKMLSSEQLPHFLLGASMFDFINQVVERIYQLRFSNHPDKLQLIQGYLQNILLELQYFHFANDANEKSKSDELITNFKKLLLKEILHNPKPHQLAKSLNVSTNHLNKILKHHTKFTTSQWINRQKIAEAKYLLHYSHSSITEIAFQLGFSEVAHFSKFFKKHTNQKPSEYKND